jgi:hypothetical protein
LHWHSGSLARRPPWVRHCLFLLAAVTLFSTHVCVAFVVVTIAAPFDHRMGSGVGASNATNSQETGKGSDGKDGTI